MSGNNVLESPSFSRHTSRNVIFALSFATAAEGIFLGGILPILPEIGRVYQITSGEAFWVNAAFLLAVGVTCPTLSRLGDIYGHKKLTIITLIMTSLGIFIDIIAPNYYLFLVGRLFLGLCPAVTPLAVGIFRKSLPEEAALVGIGVLAAAMTAGHAVGPVFAGYVFSGTGSISWVFASWLILLVPSVVIVAAVVPESPTPVVRSRMDWLGAGTLGIGVAALLFALAYGPKAGWGNPVVIGTFCIGILSLMTWYLAEGRTAYPLVDLRMLGNPEGRPYYISSFLHGAVFYGSQTAVVLFLGTSYQKWGFGFSVSALTMGWLMLPQNIMNILGSLAVKRVVRSLGGYRSAGIIGSALVAAGFAGMMLANEVLWLFIVFVVINGFGAGFMQPTLSGRISEVCEESQRGISTGMFQTFKNIGGSMATALGSAVFAAMLISGTTVASKGAYMVVFGGCLLLSVCMLLVIASEGLFSDKPDRMRIRHPIGQR
jgi:MFS family permease